LKGIAVLKQSFTNDFLLHISQNSSTLHDSLSLTQTSLLLTEVSNESLVYLLFKYN